MGDFRPRLGGDVELRRDRPFSQNFHELMKADRATAELLKNSPSKLVELLREGYEAEGLPRHPEKSVEPQLQAEVQGAWLDGETGTLCAKPGKIAKYVALAVETLRRATVSQRELQVLGGGFVYISMFKRPLLSGLNEIWRDIVALDSLPKSGRWPLSKKVAHEICRFVGLIPLAFMNFRAGFDERVTASDASTSGGGACVSRGLTPYGQAASSTTVRWAQVHNITESVASMDWKDCQRMNLGLDCSPWFVDSGGVTLCSRPRLYWLSWDPHEGEGVETPNSRWN